MTITYLYLVLLNGRVVGRFNTRCKAQEFISLIDPSCRQDIEILEARTC